MATRYCRSTDGSNADNGTTWALAKATLAGIDAIDTAGDLLCVSQVHSESTAGAVTLAFAGTSTSGTRIVCGNDGAEPPTAVAATAVVATTGANAITLAGNNLSCHGIIFKAGSVGNAGSIGVGQAVNQTQSYRNCEFWLNNTATSALLGLANQPGTAINLRDCNVKFGNTVQGITISGSLRWNGGAMVSGSTTPATLFKTFGSNGGGGAVLVENVDFSGFAATMNMVLDPTTRWPMTFRNCKLPASWSGTLGTFSNPGRVEMYNCDSGNTNYKVKIADYLGTVDDETTLIRSGGASDGVTPLAWKILSTASAVYPAQVLASPEIVRRFPGTPAEVAAWSAGASITVTVEIIANLAAALNDDEAWLEVCDLGTASLPLGVFAPDAKADVLATAAAQTASTITGWDNSNVTARANSTAYSVGDFRKVASNAGRVFFCTTAGTTAGSEPAGYATAVDGGSVTDNTAVFRAATRQKLSVTITPQLKGFLHARVMLAKASTTIYVDPKLAVA